MANSTVQVNNLSSNAKAQDIQDFFSYAGHVENVDLRSDGESQVAYVTFTDSDSSDAAMILSGSTIANQEINISTMGDPGQGSTEDTKPVPVEAEFGIPASPQARPISKAEDMVKSMLSKGFVLGKETLERARSLDESYKNRSHESSTTTTTSEPKQASRTWAMGHISKLKLAESWSAGRQTVNKQVVALNERFQIGGRAMAAVAMAQQGLNGAIARVRRNHGDQPPLKTTHQDEQVQLTEMCILKDESRIHPLNNEP